MLKIIEKIENSIITIDSLDIKIPLESVKVLNPNLLNNWVLFNLGTGELCKTEKKPFDIYEGYGYKIKFDYAAHKYKNPSTGVVAPKPYLIIKLTSKILERSYFEGLTKENSRKIYNWIMRTKFVEFPYSILLSSECIDVDWKCDCVIEREQDFFSELKEVSRPSKLFSKGYTDFRLEYKEDGKKKNIITGIQFGDRKTNKKSSPFIKVYNKQIELHTKSKDFYSKFLSCEPLVLPYRIELTVKNKMQLNQVGLKDTSYKSLTNLNHSFKSNLFKKSLYKHIDFNLPNKRASKLNVRDKFDQFFLKGMKDGSLKKYLCEKFNIDEIIEIFCYDYDVTKNQKHNLKKRLKSLL